MPRFLHGRRQAASASSARPVSWAYSPGEPPARPLDTSSSRDGLGMEPRPVFSVTQDGEVLIITPQRNVTSLAEADAEREMDVVAGLLRGDGPHRVVVDFSRVAYFGSSILEALLRVWSQIRPQGRMVLCGLSEVGDEIVRLAKFDTLWQLCPTRREALVEVRK